VFGSNPPTNGSTVALSTLWCIRFSDLGLVYIHCCWSNHGDRKPFTHQQRRLQLQSTKETGGAACLLPVEGRQLRRDDLRMNPETRPPLMPHCPVCRQWCNEVYQWQDGPRVMCIECTKAHGQAYWSWLQAKVAREEAWSDGRPRSRNASVCRL